MRNLSVFNPAEAAALESALDDVDRAISNAKLEAATALEPLTKRIAELEAALAAKPAPAAPPPPAQP